MAEDSKYLKEKIKDLEIQLQSKSAELIKYKQEVIRANEQIEALFSEISKEVGLATRIQKILSPTQMPNIAGFEISTKFRPGSLKGGDYFDIFEHEDRMKFGIIIGSASGHMMSALFLSVLLKMSGKFEAKKGLPPNEVLGQLANELLADMGEKDEMNLFYGVIDRRNFELNYVLVGDITVGLQRRGAGIGKNMQWLDPGQPSLRKTSSSEFISQNISLDSKDRISICSPGLAKVRNSSGEIFGRDQILKCMSQTASGSVHDCRNEILIQTESWSGQIEPDKDQTLIVIEAMDRVIKLAKR